MATASRDPMANPSTIGPVARGGLAPVFLAWLGFGAGIGVGCATSDQMLEAQTQLQTVEAQRRQPAQCKPGRVEPCYGGPAGTAGRGSCVEGTRACVEPGLWQECVKEVQPKTETCNGADDDCDGIVDNGFERHGALCWRGKGACRSQGTWKCGSDGTSSECGAAIIQPTQEICDKIDNDCDGEIDDGDVKGTGDRCSTGKAGVCNQGAKKCVGGNVKCVQLKTPNIEICNKLDDDCDNQVDEDCVTEEEAKKRRG